MALGALRHSWIESGLSRQETENLEELISPCKCEAQPRRLEHFGLEARVPAQDPPQSKLSFEDFVLVAATMPGFAEVHPPFVLATLATNRVPPKQVVRPGLSCDRTRGFRLCGSINIFTLNQNQVVHAS